ncbi:MAG: hypothetical protein JNK48_17825 [Bryobacterales bacterium]|nr:hypothetical protein [Bryobacterales bacterium]
MSDQPRTEAQQSASRENGKLSHGPVTEEGRLRSARNSTTHGLYSSRIVLTNESQEMFDHLLRELTEEYKPVGPTEHQFVEDMANARWKMRRLRNMDAAAIDTDMFVHRGSFDKCFQPNDPAMRHHDAATSLNSSAKGLLDFYDRSLSRLHRIYRNSLADLQKLQARRLAQPPQPQPQAQPQQPAPPHPASSGIKMEIEPKPLPFLLPYRLTTYSEPEQFAFLSAVDHSQLNPSFHKIDQTASRERRFLEIL